MRAPFKGQRAGEVQQAGFGSLIGRHTDRYPLTQDRTDIDDAAPSTGACMFLAAARATRKAPVRFVWSTAANSSGVTSKARRLGPDIPALFTTIRSEPTSRSTNASAGGDRCIVRDVERDGMYLPARLLELGRKLPKCRLVPGAG